MVRIDWRLGLALPLALCGATSVAAAQSGSRTNAARPQGPCDIYAAAGNPCVAAHSTTRALYAAYKGPLYQVKRTSDGRTMNIGIVPPAGTDAGGYANAAAQDAFCANTMCVINRIYDQSGTGNDLLQASPGTFKGPAMGAFDTQPLAAMAPVTIHGHKAYGVFIMPGMGFRNNNASHLAIDDEPEGIYSVMDGTHFDSGCCFDYGNASTNGRAVGTGTMETTYFGTSTVWGTGGGSGPWIMADMEGGMFSGYSLKQNAADPTIDSWRFITAVVDGGVGNHWDLRGGNAQQGSLTTFYSGARPASLTSSSYYPMRKHGAILLGTGGDNGNGSAGTFYEGAMTSGFPALATTDAVQANVVAARYDVPRLTLSRVTTFSPRSSQQVTAIFTNTTGAPVTGVRLSVSGPAARWISLASGNTQPAKIFADAITPGASVSATFNVTSPAATGAGFLTGSVQWKSPSGSVKVETTTTRVRNVQPIKINEVGFGSTANPTNQFIELYNASDRRVDLSRWSLVSTPSQWAPTQLARILAGASLAPHGFYLLTLSTSGLAASAPVGAKIIYVRDVDSLAPGATIDIDGETRSIHSVGTAATARTTIFIPVSTGPWLTFTPGTTNLPVASIAGFAIGQKIGIDLGGHYEEGTVTSVGKSATQTLLAASASAGATGIKLAAAAEISDGDTLTVNTGARKELVKVASLNGTAINLAAPLRLYHASGVNVSDPGTGVGFAPATRFSHISGDALQALGSGVALDQPLQRSHGYGAPVSIPGTTTTARHLQPLSNQWFGEALSPAAGSIALLDASGVAVVDAIVYGSQQSNSSGNGTIDSPELATLEGDQSQGGCIAVVPHAPGGAEVSVGRYPDGADTDSNCTDFHVQSAATLAAAASAGASNIKVTSVEGFHISQNILIDSGSDMEQATIGSVGTPGASMTSAALAAGATSIPVANAFGFRPGQAIVIGEGADAETAIVAAGGRRGAPTVTLESPLKFAHSAGTQVAGTGISLTSPVRHAHAVGSQIADNLPTPGAPNKY